MKNPTTSVLEGTYNGDNSYPGIRLMRYKDDNGSYSPVGDGNSTGEISYMSLNSSEEEVGYATIGGGPTNSTNGSEDGYVEIGVVKNGNSYTYNALEANSEEVVVNKSLQGFDFVVKGNDGQNVLFADVQSNYAGTNTDFYINGKLKSDIQFNAVDRTISVDQITDGDGKDLTIKAGVAGSGQTGTGGDLTLSAGNGTGYPAAPDGNVQITGNEVNVTGNLKANGVDVATVNNIPWATYTDGIIYSGGDVKVDGDNDLVMQQVGSSDVGRIKYTGNSFDIVPTSTSSSAGLSVEANAAGTMVHISGRDSDQGPHTGYKDLILNSTSGNVGIGLTDAPTAKLEVAGVVKATSFKIDDWEIVKTPDYVFEEDYSLRKLEDVEKYIQSNKHLPEIPSAKEMGKNGVDLAEMNMLLLKKVEELTLYVIEQNKTIEKQSKRIEGLEQKTK